MSNAASNQSIQYTQDITHLFAEEEVNQPEERVFKDKRFTEARASTLTEEQNNLIEEMRDKSLFFQQDLKNLKIWRLLQLKQDGSLESTLAHYSKYYRKLNSKDNPLALYDTGRCLCPERPYAFDPKSPKRILKVLNTDARRINTAPLFQYKPRQSDEVIHQELDNLFSLLFPVDEERLTVKQFLGHIFQKPHERPSFSILLTGEMGIGKSQLFEGILEPLLKHTFKPISDYTVVEGTHDLTFEQSYLALFDDCDWRIKYRRETFWKNLITNGVMKFNPKHEREFSAPVYTRCIFISNERSPLVDLKDSSRRWFMPQHINYVKPIYNDEGQLDGHASRMHHRAVLDAMLVNTRKALSQLHYQTFLNYFLSVDLEGFDSHDAPLTETFKQTVLMRSADDAEQMEWINEMRVFSRNQFKERFKDFKATDSDLTNWFSSKGLQAIKRQQVSKTFPNGLPALLSVATLNALEAKLLWQSHNSDHNKPF